MTGSTFEKRHARAALTGLVIMAFVLASIALAFPSEAADGDGSTIPEGTQNTKCGCGCIIANGITYTLDGDEATVVNPEFHPSGDTPTDSTYSGAIVIPGTITCDGNQYTVTAIGQSAFGVQTNYEQNSLVISITLPDTLKVIEQKAFENCVKLTELKIPESVTEIGTDAFYGCNGVITINIPAEVKDMGTSYSNTGSPVFSLGILNGWDNAKNVTFSSGSPFENVNGVLYEGDTLLASLNPEIASVNVREGTVHIADGAFLNCVKLATVELPDGLKTIGNDAFNIVPDVNKKQPTLPPFVPPITVVIPDPADVLEYMNIPSSVEKIGINFLKGALKEDGSSVLVMEGDTPPTIGTGMFVTTNGKTSSLCIYYPAGSESKYSAVMGDYLNTNYGYFLTVDYSKVSVSAGGTVEMGIESGPSDLTLSAVSSDSSVTASFVDGKIDIVGTEVGEYTVTVYLMLGQKALTETTINVTVKELSDDSTTTSTTTGTTTDDKTNQTITTTTTTVTDNDTKDVISTTTTISTSTGDGSIKTEATVSGDVATVTVTAGSGTSLDDIIGQADLISDFVTEDISLPNSISKTEIVIEDTKGASVTLTLDVVESLNDQATEMGASVQIVVGDFEEGSMTSAQISALGNGTAFELSAVVVDENEQIIDRLHNLREYVDAFLPFNGNPSGMGVFYIDENGKTTDMKSTYDKERGGFVFKTNHFSLFAVMETPEVVPDDPVASIWDKEFATLQEAFKYAQDGDTIELQDHIIQKDGILLDKKEHSITLDLNGKTLNVEEGASINNRVIKIESGSLTVIDSSSDKTGKIIASGSGTTQTTGSGAYGAFRIEADGKLIANYITLENSRPWGMNVKVCGGEAYLTGVTITSSYGGGIEVTEADLGTHSKAGIAVLVDCDFIQKGYFDHCSSAVSVSGGSSVTVKGGSYIGEGRAIYVFSSGGYITVEDGYFSGDMEAIRAEIDTGTYPEYVGGVIIEGGEFDGKFSITSPATLAISGGTFDNNPSDYVSDGFHAFESTDGTDTIWTVEKIAATSGDKIYPTVQDAIDDAGTGTITLADDSAENLTVTGTAIISANGHDITGTVTVSGTLTLTGTGSVSSVILSSTTAKLVVEGPTVTSVTDSVSNYHVVSSTVDGVTTYSLARTSSGGGGTVTPPVNPPVTPDEPETDVEEHPDGSTTETTTETTTNPDGSKTESTTVTEKDPEGNVTGSTVTETTTSEKEEDGVKETVTSTTVTTNDSEGNRTGSTSTSTTTTVTDTTTTVTEKEEVKDADDRVTSSTEKVTETTRIDGGTVTSETTEVKDAAGNVTSSTESVKAESDDGNVRTEAVTESGTTTVNTTVSVSASGQVDDALIQQAVAQSDAVSEKVSAESPDRVIQIGTGSDTDVTLSPESMSAIADTGAEFKVISETGSMQLDRDVVGTLTEPGEDITVRMAESDDSELTEAQQSAKGDRFGVTLTATVGTDRYHLLGGTVTVTIPYAESMGADPGSLGVFYIDEDGIRTFMESVYDQALKSFVFQTDHFSLFIVDDLPAPAVDGDDTMLYAGIAAVIVVVIVAAAVLYRKH